VYQLLKSRNWRILQDIEGVDEDNLSIEIIKEWPVFPIKLNRTKLPGFFTHWPKGEDFETLYSTYSELFPEAESSIDKVSLMVVWLTMRIPYHVEGLEEKSEE
jgi:hypothetical protein